MTITNRKVMYVGGFRSTLMRAEHAIAAQATDDMRLRMQFSRGGVSLAPICTTTGAGSMTVTWTTVPLGAAGAARGYVLCSMSQATITHVGSFIGWGW